MGWKEEVEIRISESFEIIYDHVGQENPGLNEAEIDLMMCQKAKTLFDGILSKYWRKIEEAANKQAV